MKSVELAKNWGYLTEEEVYAIKRVAGGYNRPDAVIINIGAGFGTSGLAFREAAPRARVVTIDIRDDENPWGGLLNERNAFSNSGLDLPEQILGCSWDVGSSWAGDVDLVFVDGDHGLDAVIADIGSWLPRTTGAMIFHDYGSPFHGAVKEVVDELMSNFDIIERTDTLIAFSLEEHKK